MWTEEKRYRRKSFETDRRPAHTFQIFHGNQQRWHAGDAGSLGAKKRDYTPWNRRYDTSHLAAGVEGEADPCGTGTVPAERGICFAGGGTLSWKSTQVRTVR